MKHSIIDLTSKELFIIHGGTASKTTSQKMGEVVANIAGIVIFLGCFILVVTCVKKVVS